MKDMKRLPLILVFEHQAGAAPTNPTQLHLKGSTAIMTQPTDDFADAFEQIILCDRLAHVATPAGASADSWFSIRCDDGDAMRSLHWVDYDAGDGVGASVTGWQDEAGDVTSAVTVWLPTEAAELTASTARALAAALLQAADELERIER